MPECKCGKPAQIHLTDKDKDREDNWCLDCAPPEYEEMVYEMRTHGAWQDGWEEEMRTREADGRTIPTWRVPACSAFSTGWKAALEWARSKDA